MPNLVFLTCPSLQILVSSDWVICNFRIFGQSLIKRNCDNSRTSDDIGHETIASSDWVICNFRIFGQSLIKRNCDNSRTSDDIGHETIASCRKIVVPLPFLQFMTNLKQSGPGFLTHTL